MTFQIPETTTSNSDAITVNSNIIQKVIKAGSLYNRIDFLCRNTAITGDNAAKLIALTKELTHTAIMLEEEVTGKPAATISTTAYPTYDLESVMDFGKWKGHIVRDVIQRDPIYVMWAHDHVKKFKLPAEVVDALITIL